MRALCQPSRLKENWANLNRWLTPPAGVMPTLRASVRYFKKPELRLNRIALRVETCDRVLN